MGNSTAKPSDYGVVRSYRCEEWIREEAKRDVEIWKNKQTHEKVQVYGLQETPSVADMKRFQLRTSQQHLVKVHHIAISNSQMFCVSTQFAQLLVQYIPIRLSEVQTLDLEEGLTVLHSALKGFQCIDTLFGHIKVNEDLVGFNCEGKPKVWLNRQFNLNFCQHQLKKEYYSQSEEAKKVFKMIDGRVKGRTISDYVRRQLLEKDLNFQQSVELIQEYAFREELSLRRYVRIDLLERQLGLHRKRDRYSSAESFSSRLHPQQKNNQFHITRIQSCKNLAPKPPVPSLTFNNQNRSIDTQRSHVGMSPVEHRTSPRPKITFNQNVKTTPHKVSLNTPTLNLVKETPTFEFVGTSATPHVKLQKMSVNQYSFKIPQSFTRNNSFVHPNKRVLNKKIIQGPQSSNIERGIPSPETNSGQPEQHHPQTEKSSNTQQGPQIQNEKKEGQTETLKEQIQTNHVESHSQHSLDEKEVPSPSKATVISQKSIIDKVKALDKQSQDQDNTISRGTLPPAPAHNNEHDKQQVGVSGVFNQSPKEQMQIPSMIVEEPIEQEMKTVTFNCQWIQQKQRKKEIPINFQSFGASLMSSMENISFAPKLPTDHPNKQEIPAQTAKSVDIEEEEEELSSATIPSGTRKKSIIQLVESSANKERVSHHLHGEFNDMASEESKHQQSFDEKKQQIYPLDIKENMHPLYQQCTSVESKFHITLRKDNSNVEHSSNDHSNRVSAFAQVEDQDPIKNQFQNMLQKDGIRMNRVSSQYQMLKKEASQPSHTPRHLRKDQPLEVKSNIHLKETEDEPYFLDVQFLQKSLDLKMKSVKKSQIKEEDELNISKLDQKLEKFSASKISQSCSPPNKEPEHEQSIANNLTMNSERLENNRVPSIQYHTSIPEKNFHRKEQSAQDIQVNPPVIDYYESIVSQCRTKQNESTQQEVGVRTTDQEGFYSIFKNHRSLGKDHQDIKHKTYNYGEKWRKDSSKRQSYTSLSKDSNRLLEERYQKYVKKHEYSHKEREQSSFLNGRNYSRFSDKLSPFKAEGESTISYDHLRSLLRNN